MRAMQGWAAVWAGALAAILVQAAEPLTGDPLAPGRAWVGAIGLPARNYVQNGGFEQGLEGWSWFVHR
ncbi:MAG: hypothetical protein GX595_09755, partial [Lentisphaerae bacterium]|nr:hypothetical protein [Lentisphaerota bacterium]